MGRGFGFGGGRKHFGIAGCNVVAGDVGNEGVGGGERCIGGAKD